MIEEDTVDNYSKLVRNNLDRLYASLPGDLGRNLPGEQSGNEYRFTAFGRTCTLTPAGITLGGAEPSGVIGILLSLYALNAVPDRAVLEPLRAFKAFPNSAPYAGAFAAHTEQILVSSVDRIKTDSHRITQRLDGQVAPSSVGGDFAFVVWPMPKIYLCYIFYEADADFPPSVTCLYSNNANRFMPIDGLADVGEYTSKTILEMIH